jgi:hypothetical protein
MPSVLRWCTWHKTAISLNTAPFEYQDPALGRLYAAALGRGTIMTTPSKAALRAELEAALANYRGPVKQCPAAPPPGQALEEELEPLDDEDEADELIVSGR